MNRDRSITRAALFRAAITSAEVVLGEAIEDAELLGRQDIADKLRAAIAHIERGHGRANEAATLIAGYYEETNVALWSGPEDKPPPPGPQ